MTRSSLDRARHDTAVCPLRVAPANKLTHWPKHGPNKLPGGPRYNRYPAEPTNSGPPLYHWLLPHDRHPSPQLLACWLVRCCPILRGRWPPSPLALALACFLLHATFSCVVAYPPSRAAAAFFPGPSITPPSHLLPVEPSPPAPATTCEHSSRCSPRPQTASPPLYSTSCLLPSGLATCSSRE